PARGGAAVAGEPRWCCSAAHPEVVGAVESGDEVAGPGPVAAEAAEALAAGGGELAGGVEQAVAESFRFGGGQVAVEGQGAAPGEQVVGAEGEVEPGGVDRERVRWQVGESEGFGVADLFLG